MRNPGRIPRIAAKLLAVWYQNPDLRLGQLIDNARMKGLASTRDGNRGTNIFYVEDDVLEQGLDALVSETKL